MNKLKEAMKLETIAKLKGLAEGYVAPEPEYKCKMCSDMGMIRPEVAADDVRWGRLIICPNVDCPTARQHIRDRLEKFKLLYQMDMDIETYQSYTFDTWKRQTPDMIGDKRMPLAAAQYLAGHWNQEFSLSGMLDFYGIKFETTWVEDQQMVTFIPGKGQAAITLYNSIGNWLVFEGEYGTGKTGLALATLRALPHDVFHLAIHLPKFLELFQATYSYEDEEERVHMQHRLTKPLIDADVLLIDEMNVAVAANGRDGGAASEDKTRIVLNYIIQPRWLAKQRKATIITTNKPPEEFEKHWDRRITSRVFERAHWMRFNGLPLRRRNRPN